VTAVEAGEEVRLRTVDTLGGRLSPESSAEDVAALDWSCAPPLSPPLDVVGVEPGDLVVVDVLACEPAEFGITARPSGVGLLGEPDDAGQAFLVLWRLAEGFARSAELPGATIAARPGLSVFGSTTCTPAAPTLAAPGPDASGVRTGAVRGVPRVAVGSRLLLPVWSTNTHFQVGESHFRRGDCAPRGGGIEMSAGWRLRFGLRKGEAARLMQRRPRVERRTEGRQAVLDQDRFIASTGAAELGRRGGRRDAIRTAARDALADLVVQVRDTYRYSPEQATALCGIAARLRIDAPPAELASVTALLPLNIFDDERTWTAC
jgi:formamidase